MKLKFYKKDNKKNYTLKEFSEDKKEKTKDAHYKFIKFKKE